MYAAMNESLAARSVSQVSFTRLIGLVLFVSIVGLGPPDVAAQGTACEKLDASELRSADDAWIAEIYGEVCDQGLYSSASVKVVLSYVAAPSISQVILGMTMPTAKSEWPTVEWGSTSKVVIDLPSSADIGLQVAHFQGIDVDVRFCPPGDRASWLAYRASIRKWQSERIAWTEAKKRDPTFSDPEPVRPDAPIKVASPKCSR